MGRPICKPWDHVYKTVEGVMVCIKCGKTRRR
jgi:hypothetical protein